MLDAALGAGREATIDVARRVCGGGPAMAPLWNICAAALAEFAHPGRYAMRRAEIARAPNALARAATAALRDALQGSVAPRVLTLSHSGSVARVLTALGDEGTLEVICAESLPGGEGARLAEHLRGHRVRAALVRDAELTTYFSPDAAVVVGADSVAADHWTNKVGTYGLAAAAWFTGVPVYVVASRDKAASAGLVERLTIATPFERTPAQLATLVLTDGGPIPPDALPTVAERYTAELPFLLDVL